MAGIITTSIGFYNDYGINATVQADGRILVAGYSWNGINNDYAVVRYNSNGSLDSSFDDDGIIVSSLGNYDDESHAVTVQADGKILVTGGSYNANRNNFDFGLVRYNSDGSLDSSFGNSGIAKNPADFYNEIGYSVTVQTDGKILVAGTSFLDNTTTTGSSVLVRYNSDGSLDTSFNGNGRVITDLNSFYTFTYSVTVQTDGKILLAGSSHSNTDSYYDFTLLRYNSDGSLDNSFSGDGIVKTPISFYNNAGYSVAMQSDGKILVAGSSYTDSTSTTSNFALVRYNSNGSLDTSFSGDGKVTTGFNPAYSYAYSVAVQADGKILVAGETYKNNGYADFTLVRYKTDGSLDTSFNGNGKVTTDISSYDDVGYCVIVQADGKILLAGTSHNGINTDFALVRYNSDGSLDSSFDGLTIVNNPPTGTVTLNDNTPEQNQILTVSNTLADADGLGTISYQWQANGVAIGTGDSYTLTQAEVNKTITVIASYTDGKENLESKTSVATAAVKNINDLPTGTVTIAGITVQEQTLTASNTLADIDGLGAISYQWQANGIAIGTGDSYTLTGNEVGKMITVIASYTDLQGTDENKTSTATSPVISNSIPGFVVTANDTLTGEDGDTAVISIKLATAPTRNVSVSFTSSDLTEGIIPNPTLTFTPTNWSVAQAITVVGKNDYDYFNDGNQPYSIRATVTTNDVNYQQTLINPIGLTNQEDVTTVDDPRIPIGTVRDRPLKIYGDAIVDTTVIDVSTGLYKVTGTVPVSDILYGLDGNDTLYGGNLPDDLSGGIGDDILYGENDADFLYGQDGNDKLFGGADADSLEGGAGNDTLTGGSVDDLAVDTMVGGAGNDTYYVGHSSVDIITDKGSATDIDTVFMPYQLTSYTLPSGIENGTITAGTQASNLTGNDSNNSLTGNNGKNVLTGGAGDDTLNGGAGDDTLYASTAAEAKSALSIKSITPPSKDKLNGGDGNDIAIGGTGRDTLRGDSGNDVLDGRAGKDTLSGGVGMDVFKFTTAPKASNVDTITDFSPVSDTIKLENAVFKALTTTGKLAAGLFKSGAGVIAASDANDYLIYNTTSGKLYYDADGNADQNVAIQIALIGTSIHPALTHADFMVI